MIYRLLLECTSGILECTSGILECTSGIPECTSGILECTSGIQYAILTECSSGISPAISQALNSRSDLHASYMNKNTANETIWLHEHQMEEKTF